MKRFISYGFAVIVLFSQVALATFNENRWLTTNDIPANAREWLRLEQVVNDRDMGSWFHKLNFDAMDQTFDPTREPVWQIGYLEIPIEEAWFRIDAKGLSKAAQAVKFVTRGNKKFVRFFIHPQMEDRPDYKKLYKKYGDGNKPFYGEFGATTTSSPRSLFVWNIKKPSQRSGEKVSLAVNIQTDRKNEIDKLERAYAVDQAMRRGITASDKKKYRFVWFGEPMVQNTFNPQTGEGVQYGNITRDFGQMPLGTANGKTKLVPGFALTAGSQSQPLLSWMIAACGGGKAEAYIREMVVQPLVGSFAYLMFSQGLIGEPHQQNVAYEVGPDGCLTGKVVYRDLDAFKPEIELRHIRGRSDAGFLEHRRPYKMNKMGKAETYYRTAYQYYLKHNWAYNILDSIKRYKYPAGSGSVDITEIFDQEFLVAAADHLGSAAVLDSHDMRHQRHLFEPEWKAKKGEASAADKAAMKKHRAPGKHGTFLEFIEKNLAALKKLLPKVKWDEALESEEAPNLTATQLRKVLTSFSVGELFLIGNLKNKDESLMFDPNMMVEAFKTEHFYEPDPNISQKVLELEYKRLVFNYRSSTITKIPKDAFFVLHHGSITCHTAKGAIHGHAFLEPESVLELNGNYYAGSYYDRMEPNRKVLSTLYAVASGQKKSISDSLVKASSYKFPNGKYSPSEKKRTTPIPGGKNSCVGSLSKAG